MKGLKQPTAASLQVIVSSQCEIPPLHVDLKNFTVEGMFEADLGTSKKKERTEKIKGLNAPRQRSLVLLVKMGWGKVEGGEVKKSKMTEVDC
jgi:hypothetical protein